MLIKSIKFEPELEDIDKIDDDNIDVFRKSEDG